MKDQNGFTLIELMIVVAIIALLSALAIPQYQNYILRTQMVRASAELHSLRAAIEVCESDGNTSGTCVLDTVNSDMLITLPTVTFNPSTITATFGANSNPKLHGGTISIQRVSTGWDCTMTVSGVSAELIPRECR